MTIHIAFTVNDGFDWSAAVSTGAAVVQAIGAVVAIVYSGKLARDAATREKAAEEANVRHIAEANAAAADQRRLDVEADRARQFEEGRIVYNAPLHLALQFGGRARAELINQRDEHAARVEREENDLRYAYVGIEEQLLLDSVRRLEIETQTGEAAAALRALRSSIERTSDVPLPPQHLVHRYDAIIMRLSGAMKGVESILR